MVEMDPDAETYFDTNEAHSMIPVKIKLMFKTRNGPIYHMLVGKAQIGLPIMQSDKDLHCPLPESLYTVEYHNFSKY